MSVIGEKGVTRTVAQIMKNPNYVSPFQSLKFYEKLYEHAWSRKGLPQNPGALPGAQYPLSNGNSTDNGGKHYGGPFNPQTIGIQFDTDIAGNITPPDTHGAVGPTQILAVSNSRVRVYNKDGSAGTLNATLSSFFSAVGGVTLGTSDPRATFDRITQRWFVCCITVNNPNRILLAVSSGPTIVDGTSFTYFFIQNPSGFADYPSLGVDANGVYIGDNTFTSSFAGTHTFVIQKSSVLGAGPIFSTRFQTSTTTSGVYAPRGVDNDDPASTDGYIIGVDSGVFSLLVMRKVFNPGTTTPTISGNLNISVPTTDFPVDVPTNGGLTVDSLDDRLFHVQMHLNRKTNKRTIFASHNILGNNTGAGTSAGDRDVCHWYEIDPAPAAPTLVQSGTVFDSAAVSPLHCWMPSCAISGQGHMAIGLNRANSATKVQIAAAGRLAGDALGTTQAQTLVLQSTLAYNVFASRWGDYSAVAVDPTDDQTLWEFAMYSGGSSWITHVNKLIAPPPSPVNTVTPNTLNQGQTTNLTVTGIPTNGSEYYDTDASYPKRLVCAFSGTGVTVNSVTFSHANPQQVVINVTVAGNAAGGARDLTITNPDGQSVVKTSAISINASQNQTVSPSSFTMNLGQVSSGNLASLAADDNNALVLCKFLVPTLNSPIIQFVVDGNTSFTTLSAYSFEVKAKMVNLGSFNLIGEGFNFTSNTYDATGTIVGLSTAFQTLNVPSNAAPQNYLGGAGALRGRVRIQQTGPSVVTVPCSAFEYTVWKVTGS